MRISRPLHGVGNRSFAGKRSSSTQLSTPVESVFPDRHAVVAFQGFWPRGGLWTTVLPMVRLYWPPGRRRAALFDLSTDETHLPAERTQAEAEARFPRPHVDACRPSHPQASPREGAQAPVRVAVQRRNRLSRSRDFDAVYRHGRSVSTRFLTLYWFPQQEDPGEPRLGLAVPKAAGNAVVRNRIKRQVRQISPATP